jgi:SAM-dependent methyltransferase
MSRFGSESFDYVVVYGNPLGYVLDRSDQALAECLRLLKPGGLLILSVASLWGSAHRHLHGVFSIPA